MARRPIQDWRWDRIIAWAAAAIVGLFVVYEGLYIVISTLVAVL